MDFYTNVSVYGSKILYRGVQNGRRVSHKIDYHPKLYVPSTSPTNFSTIYGQYLEEITVGNIKETRDFIKMYDKVEGFSIYGNQRFEYTYIAETFKEDIEWDPNSIIISPIDIEVGSENGFPEPSEANEPITAITLRIGKTYHAFGTTKFVHDKENVKYVKCSDEEDLIKRFMGLWMNHYPDVITGWNVKFFDIPYLINRMIKLFGESFAKKISPWGYFYERNVVIMGREQRTYVPAGIATLDYLELYRKFAPGGNSQDSYKLDAICQEELGEGKLSYEESGSLHKLYKENPQLFMEYNIRDAELIDKLDDKLKLIDLSLTLAYDSKSNYEDVFTQVRMWDNIIFNHLLKDNIIVPPVKHGNKDTQFVGAYVKDPIIGLHDWVASFDLNSLYPNLIIQYNISPETLIDPDDWHDDLQKIRMNCTGVEDLLHKKVDTSALHKHSVTMTPNRHFFRKDKQGFLPNIMETMYEDRAKYKNKAIEAKKELEKETDLEKRKEIEKRIARYNNLQLAKKVSLNSGYGALGSNFFRFFDIRQASAITTAGQLSIRWIEKDINVLFNKLLKTTNEDYVIASDTDSIYISFDRLVRNSFDQKNNFDDKKRIISFLDKVCEDKIQPYIDKSYSELARYLNVYAQKMVMKREALADRGIWTAKKRYILNVYNNEGVEYKEPKIKIMGLEAIKSSTPSACRKKIKEALQIILTKTEDDVIKFIADFYDEFRKCDIADISFPRGVNGLDKYAGSGTAIFNKGTPMHVRGSLIYNNWIKEKSLQKSYPIITNGEKIRFIYLKEPNYLRTNVIGFPVTIPKELDLRRIIDYDTQYQKSFVEPLKIILDAIGWRTEKTSSLEDFFT